MSIKGSLKDHPLSEVIAILSMRRESGRLYVDFNSGQGLFEFNNGELAAAYFGALTGFSAVNLALHMEGTQFRFLPNDNIDTTHFSDKDERFLLNRLLDTLLPTLVAGRNLENSHQVQPNPPEAPEPEPQQDQFSNKGDLQVETAPTFVLPSRPDAERRSRASWAVSILLIALLAATIAAFLGRPRQQAASLPGTSRPIAEVNSEKSKAPSSQTTASTRSVSENTGHRLPQTEVDALSSPSNNDSPKPNKVGASVEARGESRATPQHSFREIPIVIRVEDGHVAEAYVSNHQPGMEAFESTAIRLARQRRYPKAQLGTQTIVFKVANEQQGVAKK